MNIREMTYSEMAEKAIEAWDRGETDLALEYVGTSADEVDPWPKAGVVYLRGSSAPTGGNSPRMVRRCVKLEGNPAKCRLAEHILSRAQ